LANRLARIHETNLKKQGVLALTFRDAADYDRIAEGDRLTFHCSRIAPGSDIEVEVKHTDGTREHFVAGHTYNAQQIAWLRAGSALNAAHHE
jgi:aconitate hydratase